MLRPFQCSVFTSTTMCTMICAVTMDISPKPAMQTDRKQPKVSHQMLLQSDHKLHAVCIVSHVTLHISQVTLHFTDPTSHITRWGPHRKSTESKGWPCSPRESCYEIKPRPTPADFNNSAYSQSPTFIFSSVRVEGWWGMLEAKHSANSWLFPGPRYHWPGFLLGQNRAWTIEFWAAGCSLFAYLACHADEATSLDMSLHHPAALECTLHHN